MSNFVQQDIIGKPRRHVYMKSTSVIILFIVLSFFSCKRNENWKPKERNIQAYDISIYLDTTNRLLQIETLIKLEKPDSLNKIDFLFSDFASIEEVKLNARKTNKYVHDDDTLFIELLPLEKIDIFIVYSLPIDSFENDGNIILTRPMKWCPFVYDDISSLKMKIILPANYKAYSSGREINSDNNIFEFYNELNAGFPVIMAKDEYYSEYKKNIENIEIIFAFHNNDSALIHSIMNECVSTIKFCNDFIGNYNKDKLTFIEFPNAGYCQSIETFILAGEVFVDYYNTYPQMKFWVSHETIHQWIGAGFFTPIKNETKLTWFITESLTEYIRYQYIEKKYGADSLQQLIKQSVNEYETEIKGTEQDLPIIANQPNRITYLIGPLIFHSIRLEIGDEKWQDFIRQLYSDNYGKILTYDKFYETLNLYASDSLMNKMEYWLNSKGIPDNNLRLGT